MNADDVQSVDILNTDKEESTISATEFILNKKITSESYVVSDADEELLILVSFTHELNIKSIKVHALCQEHDEMSAPKKVHIYKTKHVNINFDDIKSMKSDKTIICNSKQLQKGQNINLQKTSKNAVKFKKTKYLAIYVESNQNDTDTTFINGIQIKAIISKRSEKEKTIINNKYTAKKYNLDIVDQLAIFGFHITDIHKAMDSVVDKNDINQIMEHILNQTDTQFVHNNNSADSHKAPSFTCDAKDECQSVNKVIDALCFYHETDVNNEKDQHKLIQYFNEVNSSFMDHYIHLIDKHNHEIQNIHNIIMRRKNAIKCELSHCLSAIRFHRDKTKDDPQDIALDEDVMFWRNVLDSCHCYVYHLYDLGLRVKLDDIQQNKQQDHKSNDDDASFVDAHFANVLKIIKEKADTFSTLDGFSCSRYQSNKFNLTTNVVDDSDTTFMDSLYQYLQKKHIPTEEISIMANVCNDEEYDSEALRLDIGDESNIKQWLKEDIRCALIQQYLHQTKLASHSFHIGYCFFYHEYNRTSTNAKDAQCSANMNDMQGYTPPELYVSPKYASLKDELLHNTIYAMKPTDFNVSTRKANQYMHTQKVKHFSALLYIGDEERQTLLSASERYDIIKGAPLQVSNILSVLLYTDWSELCTKFSETFRSNSSYEDLESTKTRNREFSIWSKTLYETVNIFGYCGYSDYLYHDVLSDKDRKDYKFQSGPFFCGLSRVMIVPQFSMHLNAPTSTTKQIEVAQRFAGDDGIIMELNHGLSYDSWSVRCWDCCWLSDYSGEHEILWNHVCVPLKVEGIRMMSSSINYCTYFECFYYFDCMISGIPIDKDCEPRITKKHHLMLSNLVKHKSGDHQNKYPKYINTSFQTFTNHKIQIVIDLYSIKYRYKNIRDLILDEQSLLKPMIFDLFYNLETIIIHTTALGILYPFEVDIFSLISCLDTAYIHNNVTIRIQATHKYKPCGDKFYATEVSYIGISWLQLLWNKASASILSKCNGTKISVLFLKNKKVEYAHYTCLEDRLLLTRHY